MEAMWGSTMTIEAVTMWFETLFCLNLSFHLCIILVFLPFKYREVQRLENLKLMI
jgi:hypothetical protein